MKTNYKLIAVLTVPLTVLLFISCAGLGNDLIKSPSVKVTNVSIRDIRLDKQDIVVKMNIFNPNPVPIPVRGFTYRLDINDIEFANGFNEERMDLPAADDGELDLVISGDIISFLLKNRLVNRDSLDYSLSGDIAVLSSSLKFPYSKSGKIEVPSYINNIIGR